MDIAPDRPTKNRRWREWILKSFDNYGIWSFTTPMDSCVGCAIYALAFLLILGAAVMLGYIYRLPFGE